MAGTEAEMEAVFAVCAARADVDSSLLNMMWCMWCVVVLCCIV